MKTAKLNPYDIQQMRTTMTNQQIADHYNINVFTLYYWCRKNNVAVTRITDYEIEEGLKMYTVKELAYEYNVNVHLIYSRAKKLGIQIGNGIIYDKGAIIQLHEQGYNYKEIAAALGYNYTAMMNWKNRTK